VTMKPRRPGKYTEAEAIAEVRAVYRELESRPVERSCTGRAECCHFKLTGKTPYLTAGETLVAAKAVRSTGRKRLPESPEGACPLLDSVTKRCLVYDGRPFGCRTHFCAAAGGPYARRDVLDLIRRLEEVDQALGGDGAQVSPLNGYESLELVSRSRTRGNTMGEIAGRFFASRNGSTRVGLVAVGHQKHLAATPRRGHPPAKTRLGAPSEYFSEF
jgi:Fe-S-cluster containining protein